MALLAWELHVDSTANDSSSLDDGLLRLISGILKSSDILKFSSDHVSCLTIKMGLRLKNVMIVKAEYVKN